MSRPPRSATRSGGGQLRAALVAAIVGLLLPFGGPLVAPAAALPVDDVVFSEGHIDAGSYNLHDNPTAYWLEDTDNFGPTGTYEINSVTLKTQTADVTPAYLDDVDVFFDGWVWNGDWDQAELDALEAWVTAGGVLIANEDHVDADDLGSVFGLPTTGSGPSTGVVISPVATDHPIVDGPFGTWTTLASAGTTGWFDPVPPEWTVIAEDDLGRAVIVTRTWGSGHVILTAEEAVFRAAISGHEISTGNILAHAIDLVDDGTLPLVVTGPDDQTVVTGEAVSLQIDTTEGNGSAITYTVDQLPSGLSIDDETGLITGTVDTPESITSMVTATPVSGPPDSATFDWTVVADLVPAPADDAIVGTVGAFLTLDLCANDELGNAPTSAVAAGPLPDGLSITDCALSGTPTAAGLTVAAYDLVDTDADEDSAAIHIFVDPASTTPDPALCRPGALVSFEGSVPGGATAGDEFSAALAAGDFDGNGELDLAVGAPGDNGEKGSVTIFAAPCPTGVGQRITQAGATPSANEVGDHFGAALAAGDFDNDGFHDLAIGSPGEDTGDRIDDGNVTVLYGSATGLGDDRAHTLSQRSSHPGKAQSDDRLGSALAVGDVNGDGFADLIVGVPGEDVNGRVDAGAAMIFFGSSVGLDGAQLWKQAGPLSGGSQAGDALGTAVAAGDFDDDGYDDAVFSAPFDDFAEADGGVVHVLPGSAAGPSTAGQLFLKSDIAQTRNGASLATGDVTGDGIDDLAMGRSDGDNTGAVHLYAGGPSGLGLLGTVDQSDGKASPSEAGDEFGAAIAVVDIDADGTGELLVGAPGESYTATGPARAGAVHVYDIEGGSIQHVDQLFRTQGDTETAGVLSAGARFGATLAAGDGLVFVGALEGDGVSNAAIGTVSVVAARHAATTHLAPNCVSSCTEHEYEVGVELPFGTYRTSQAAGPCLVATVDSEDNQVTLVDIDGGMAGILQITPEHETVLIGTDCGGPWFFTRL